MPVIHIPSKIAQNKIQDKTSEMNKFLKSGKDSFVLIYMDGCGPCSATHPKWLELESKFKKLDDIGIFDIEMSNLSNINHEGLKHNIAGYPTMRHIHGSSTSDYEDCKDISHDRTHKSFLEWIDKKSTKKNNMTGGGPHIMNMPSQLNLYPHIKSGHIMQPNQQKHATRKLTHYKYAKRSGGRKGSRKYKRSINCRRPRGFSQRQFCRGRAARRSHK